MANDSPSQVSHVPTEALTSDPEVAVRVSHVPTEALTSDPEVAVRVSHVPTEALISTFNDLMMPPIDALVIPLHHAGGDEASMSSRSHKRYGGDPWGGNKQVKSRWVSPAAAVPGSVRQLGGTQLLDGRVVFHWVILGPSGQQGWPLGSVAQYAVVDSLNEGMVDGCIDPADVVELPFPNVVAYSLWQHQGELHLFIAYLVTGEGGERRVEHWTADTPDAPATTTWSKRASLQPPTPTPGGPILERTMNIAGYPLVLHTGRWVLSCVDLAPFGATASLCRVGIFTSDDQGHSWSKRLSALGFAFSAHRPATTIARDPQTGHLWFSYIHGPTGGTAIRRSTDDGTTWPMVMQPGGNRRIAYYGDNGHNLFVADYGSFITQDPEWDRRGEHIVINPNIYDSETSYLDLDIGWEISHTTSVGAVGGPMRIVQFPHLDTVADVSSGEWEMCDGSGTWDMADDSGPWLMADPFPHYTVYEEAAFVAFTENQMITSDFLTGRVSIR
jgi:hypothetical protein